MSDQLPMFGLRTSPDSHSATSSQESGSGPTRSGSQDGQTNAKSGREAVPVSPSARPAKAKRSTTKGIFGQSGFDLSNNVGRPSSLENRSQQPPLLAELLMKSKTCTKCGTERPYSAYYVNSKGRRRSICADCMKDRSRLNKRENQDRTRAAFSSWRSLNRGRALVSVARSRAKQKGIPFDLDANEIQNRIDGGVCELTGIPFDLSTPKSWNAPSLDQIAPGAGYTMGNVRVVLYSVNVMANTWGHQRIMEVAAAITSRRKERSNDLSRKLAEKLKETTDRLGSTLFTLTWSEHITPSGHVISRLRASEPLTEGSVCIGWPTPNTPSGGPNVKSTETHTGWIDLDGAATLSGWPTMRAEDAESSGMRHSRGVADTMTAVASLTAWGTPAARDWKSGDASQETLDKNARPLNELAMLTAWKTPCVPNGGRGPHLDGKTKNQIGLENEARLSGWATPKVASGDYQYNGPDHEKILNLQGQARLTAFGETPIGYLLGPNGWEIVPASGQLNAAHSRWLMGLPRAWDDCGVTAMASLRKRRKRS